MGLFDDGRSQTRIFAGCANAVRLIPSIGRPLSGRTEMTPSGWAALGRERPTRLPAPRLAQPDAFLALAVRKKCAGVNKFLQVLAGTEGASRSRIFHAERIGIMANNLSSASCLGEARRIAEQIAGPAAKSVDEQARFPSEAFAALKQAQLLSAYVPRNLGGAGLSVADLASHCESLAAHCASTAMIYAMHQIQVACVVRHGQGSPFFREYLAQLVSEQRLIASVTSEAGVGGSTRTSIAPILRDASGLCQLRKDGTVVSYGEAADDLLVTVRRSPDAPASDQALVLVKRGDCTLEKTASWDTMGMRGTCSLGYIVTATFPEAQIVPAPFGEVSAHTMVPFAHLLWSACWLGIATGAVAQARAFVRDTARKTPGVTPPSAVRLSEVSTQLQLMRIQSQSLVREFDELEANPECAREMWSSVGFALKMNNLKISASQLVVDNTTQALRICGTSGYRNDSRFSVVRYLRDAHSAALMISNDRIHASSGPLYLVHKDE